MVQLVVDDYNQITLLELFLNRNDLPHEVVLQKSNTGITPPYLIVDGIPLDFNRSMKWIEERNKNDQ